MSGLHRSQKAANYSIVYVLSSEVFPARRERGLQRMHALRHGGRSDVLRLGVPRAVRGGTPRVKKYVVSCNSDLCAVLRKVTGT